MKRICGTNIKGLLSMILTLALVAGALPFKAFAYTPLGRDGEVIVESYADLNAALSNDNGITKVYLGTDITMTAGIKIHSNKTELEISGIDPRNGVRHTLTDYDSLIQTYTIYVTDSSTIKNFKISDLNIAGKNFYGPLTVYGPISSTGITITYERVNYSGPQLGYHRYGTLHFIDCNINIITGSGGEKQEVSEAKYVIFEGKSTITSASSAYSVFWILLGGTFEVMDHASLSITANSLSTFGVFYADAYSIAIKIGGDASLHIESSNPLNRGAAAGQAPVSSFTVGTGGLFEMETTTTRSPLIQMTGDLTVRNDATFHLATTGSSCTSLLQFNSGFTLKGEDPASVLLYNPGGRVIQSASGTSTLSIDAQQINYWTATGTGTIDNWPLHHWRNASGRVAVKATVGTSGNTTVTSHTHSGSGASPNSTTFSMSSARVLSFGRFELTVGDLDETAKVITGITTPGGAAVRASYAAEDGRGGTLPDATSDTAGSYSIPLSTTLARDTTVTVKSALKYLFATHSVTVKAGPAEYFVSLSLDGSASATPNDLAENVGVTFSSGAKRQTAFFSKQILEYTGYPENSSSNAIAMLGEGTWKVILHLPYGYNYAAYKNGVLFDKSLIISGSDATECHIKIVIYKESEPPWGKQIFKSFNS